MAKSNSSKKTVASPLTSSSAAACPLLKPDVTTPLISATNQVPVTGKSNIGLLNEFIGTWNSPSGTDATGYNVMPLPQNSDPKGYILKNFPYFEEITFAPFAGGGPNRQGSYTQNSFGLFYEQRVYFAAFNYPNVQPPIQNSLIHAENGSWLYHFIVPQLDGPYGPGTVTPPNPLPVQNTSSQYNKLITIPHGNTVLMVGQEIQPGSGNPAFPTANRTMLPFTDPTVIDPSTVLTQQLQGLAQNGITVTSYTGISVSSKVDGGGIHNTTFEHSFGKVISMDTTWYIEKLSNGKTQLQYIQTIVLQFIINGMPTQFLHIDANTLQLVETIRTVNSQNNWTDTGVVAQPGSQITVTATSGEWTSNPNTNGGKLYDANGCPGLIATQPGYPLQNVNEGALIGRVGTNPPFLIGNGPVQTPPGQSGALQLVINDDLGGLYGPGLKDNSGCIQVKIKV